jgi:(1->4)-alpha-D-glucan 1-alpha-D-glucosylmutase
VDRAVIPEIAEGYLDVWGEKRSIEPRTREALLKALGPSRKFKEKKIAKTRCHEPPVLEGGGRVWGFMVQLYGLRSARNWGIGDFGDLRALIELAARLGAATVGVNPLHAGGTSPYSPSSRHGLNVLYLDVEALPEFAHSARARRLVRSKAFQRRLTTLRNAELVDYEGVRKSKLQVLELLFKDKSYPVSKGARTFALFEALREKLGNDWRRWPEAYRDPDSTVVRAFSKKNRRRVAFHEYLQWSARQQLDALQKRALELGMPIGLYVDLALGADGGGAEVWGDQEAFALEATCGAPPDEFNPKGQDWGLPPYNPRVLRARGYAPFMELLRANMPQGGALRMDHVMALMRLWWIPSGEKPPAGGYVHYPFEDLLAVLAQESRRRRCMVIGEDLGTVTPEFRQALNEAGVLSYRPLLFEKRPDGGFAPPQAYPREALTCVSTHDLPPWRGFFEAKDLSLRRQLGLSVDPGKEMQVREAEKKKLLEALKREGLDGSAASAHLFLARTPCKIMMVQPEDVFELVEQANLPGSIDEHPNWRRKVPLLLEAWSEEPRVGGLGRALAPSRAIGMVVPRATYRLQFHKGFRFRDATALVPYLSALGISHVYASPFLKARAGSVHGYDIVDHGRLNPEIGTEAELKALTAWAWCLTSCRTTWACCREATRGGSTCSRRAAHRATRNSSTSTGSRRTRSCAARCCSRCWAITMATFSSAARSSSPATVCAISTTLSR